MKKLKQYTIAGAIFVSVLGTLLHFAYEYSNNNPIIGLFTPINESTWEHMKLIFFPMLMYSFHANKKLKSQYPCIGSALSAAMLIGTFSIPVIFYTYSGILGFNLTIMDIATFYISVIIAFYSAYKLAQSCRAERHKKLLTLLPYLIVIAFIIFTIFPPSLGIFVSPV